MESQHRWLWLSKNLKLASFTGSCCVRRLFHLTICWLTRLKKSVARMLMRRPRGLQVTSRCAQVFTGQPDRNNSCEISSRIAVCALYAVEQAVTRCRCCSDMAGGSALGACAETGREKSRVTATVWLSLDRLCYRDGIAQLDPGVRPSRKASNDHRRQMIAYRPQINFGVFQQRLKHHTAQRT